MVLSESEKQALLEVEKQRDEAFISMDKDKILAYLKSQGAPAPSSEIVLWVAAHKTRLYLPCISAEEKEKSRIWLIENGFPPVIQGAQQLMNKYNEWKSRNQI